MRLYRMELHKLYHNKIFRIGLFAATALLLAYFWFAEVGGEIAAVDGSVYSGYEAVKMNKKIWSPSQAGRKYAGMEGWELFK